MTGPAPAAEVGAAYDAGLSLRGCAARFGMTRAQVERALRDAGTRLRPARQPARPPGPAPRDAMSATPEQRREGHRP